MQDLKRPKIGLVGVMCTPFRGNKEAGFTASASGVAQQAERLGFDFHVVQQGIYNLEQANSAASELTAWGADFILLQCSSFASGNFLYPFTNLPSRMGIWAVPEGPPTSEGGLPLNSMAAANLYNSLVKTTLKGYNRPVKWYYGLPEDDLFKQRFKVTIQALTALVNLKQTRIGLIGGVAPSFDNLVVDEAQLRTCLGVEVIQIEYDDVIRRARGIPDNTAQEAARLIRASATHFDEHQLPALIKSGRVWSAYQALADDQKLDALAISCWPRFQAEDHFAVCTVLGQANSSGLPAACEGDVASAVSMLALKAMSAGNVVTLMDFVAIDEADQSILFWHCGPTSPTLADETGARMQALWLFDGYGGEPVGLHNDLTLKSGQATIFGFTPNFRGSLVFDGCFDNCKPSYVGSRGWLKDIHLNGKPLGVRDFLQTIMETGFQHHYPLVYGDLSAACLELVAWCGIKPIHLHEYTDFLTG